MHISIPTDWPQISFEEFNNWLDTEAPDYQRTCYAGVTVYSIHSIGTIAYVVGEVSSLQYPKHTVFISPKIYKVC